MKSLFINNKWLEADGDEFNSINPANQKTLWQGKAASKENVKSAIDAAKNSFNNWSYLDFNSRCKYIEKYIDILKNNTENLAKIISDENGKPLWEAKTEVAAMISKYQASLSSYNTRTGGYNNNSAMLTHRAIGVMVIFGPFNFPGHLPNGHIIPALLAGNTIVFKPSEHTPMVGEIMVKYWQEAGLPKGVLNLVQGSKNTGEYLINNKNINGVLFTGSYNVGRIIHKNLAGRPEVLLALEMGGNNPLIIDEHINNLDAAVYNTVLSAFITAGQRCTCARRLYIPNSDKGENFLAKLVTVTKNLVINDFYGPVISLETAENIIKYKENLLNKFEVQELAELKLLSENSALLSPGILLNLDKNYSVIDNDFECFGPLLQVFYYEDLDDAIMQANNTKYGLSAGILTDYKPNYELFYNKIRAGIVNWNKPTTGAVGSLPFGGIGCSGNYRPSAAYAADYCAYPMATQYSEELQLPEQAQLMPGVVL